MELHVQHVRDEIAEETHASGRSKDFVDQVTPGGHKAAATSETASGEGVVAAARRHVLGKLRHGVPDKKADHGGEQKRKRHSRPGLERDDGKREDNIGGGSDMRDALENQFCEPERITPKLRRL